MAERSTIRIQHGFCSLCGSPVRLQWFLSDDPSLIGEKDGYWKVIDHANCSQNGKKGESAKGAQKAYRQVLLEKSASAIVTQRWPSKSILVKKRVVQMSLFQQPSMYP